MRWIFLSVKSNIITGHGYFATESMPQDFVQSELIGPNMDAKLMDSRDCTDSWIDGVIALILEMGTQD